VAKKSALQNAVLSTRVKRLETQLKSLEKLRINDEERYTAIKESFEKQRILAQTASMELCDKKILVYSLSNQLKEYKMFYESLKESLKTPKVLEMMINNSTIVPQRLSVLTTGVDMEPPVSIEVDSPPI